MIIAIDPGNQQSAFCLLDDERRPVHFAKVANVQLLTQLRGWVKDRAVDGAAIEMVASYGMAVGADVFETCVWAGRFLQVLADVGLEVQLVKRLPIKVHLCHSAKAKDSNIRQALVDRFAPGQPNYGKGTKAAPGWFYGFAADCWAAYALGVYVLDQEQGVAA